tara:strand:+ start:1008 stop:1187 length:180 start_codon:yes stop_codon:yes gene_type:complete
MDLTDERFHRRIIPWAKLELEGVDARTVMKEAQKQKMWMLSRKAEHRWHNQRLLKEKAG